MLDLRISNLTEDLASLTKQEGMTALVREKVQNSKRPARKYGRSWAPGGQPRTALEEGAPLSGWDSTRWPGFQLVSD